MTLVVHAGVPKAGSSLVQAATVANQALLAEAGWSALTYPAIKESATFRAVRGLLRKRPAPPDVDWDAIRVEFDRSPKVFMSFEDFLFVPNNMFARRNLFHRTQRVLDFLAALQERVGDVRIVLVLRDEKAWVESYYVQTVQKGRSWDFDEYLAASNLSSVNWAHLQELIRSRGLGLGTVGFDTIKQGQEGFLHEVFATAGVPSPRTVPSKRFNTSYSPAAIEIARTANRVLERPEDRKGVRHFLQRSFSAKTHGKYRPEWPKGVWEGR